MKKLNLKLLCRCLFNEGPAYLTRDLVPVVSQPEIS